ncbi:retrovirus-related pol polyprotein from transposon TNT 1-94 [Tanacetum coccineum]|uniref:Retrovirus-related pol polyprotein from transposon TNT 1-94 n=1 Tax=Tanacetum coccineum TaxID=301880 RepID=A0ABQ4WDL2_9ASTR
MRSLNALKFVPQQELSREQVYWLPANEIASQASTPATPVTPYVPKSPPPSQVLATLHNIKAVFPQFDAIIKERTTVKPLYVSLPCYEYAKEFALQQVVPFLDYFKKHVQTADDTIVRSSNCLCEELRSNCDREHSKVVELEAEILKKQQMLHESEKRCTFIEKNHVNLQVKFQKYKECLQNQRVCDTSNSTASNAIFEINKLKDQLHGKDDTIRNLQTQINITRMLNVGSTVGSFDKQALETELTQLKDALTSVRIQIDGYKAENVNLKRRYEELSKSNAYSRSTFTAKINALMLRIPKLNTLSSTRTASIRKSDTSVLEDLKALSWKTCQEGSLLNLSDHRANGLLDEKSVSSEDEGTTRIRAFIAIAEDEPSIGKADARSGQWVDITITCSKVTLDQLLSEQVPGNIVKALGGKGRRKENNASKEVVFTKADEYSSKPPLEITLTLRLATYVIKKTEPKVLVVQVSCSKKNASPSSEQFLLTLMEEIKGIKDHIKIPSVTSLSGSQASSSKPSKQKDYLKRFVWYLDSGCSRHMTGVKQYLHRYSKESGPKVVFGDDSLGETEGYGSVNCNGITFTRVAYVNGLKHILINISQLCVANFKFLFTKSQGTIFNQNDEVVLIAPRRRDVYVIDMSSFNKESNACFLAKASLSINWLRQKRLSHLNFKNINNLAKYNLVSGIPSLTFSKDKNCLACEKGKHHRASFKTKRSFFISKSLHFLHMDLFGPVKPQAISHDKYTLVIVDEYSRYTWVFCLKKKSDAADCIMSFIRKIETLNEVKVKQLGSDNGTEFRNHKLEEFCDEKAVRTMSNSRLKRPIKTNLEERLSNNDLLNSKRSFNSKRHVKTAYDVFKGRSLDISYFYMFGCPVHIHNHKDHLGKFDEKADDGFFLGYSSVAKDFRVFNIRRQEMEETAHVTFSKDDEVISQTSTEGDAINFNEIGPSLMMNSLNLGLRILNALSTLNSPEVTADDYPVLNLDHPESFDNLESAETQDNVTNEQISNFHHSPSDEDIHLSHVPQDRWSREMHIELVNIIREPLASITTRAESEIQKSCSAHDCVFVNMSLITKRL